MIAALHSTPRLADLAYGSVAVRAQQAAVIFRAVRASLNPVRPEELSERLFWLETLSRLVLGTSSVCNARCRFCAYPGCSADPGRAPGLMPLALARTILGRYASCGGRHVDFTSTMGEPTLCPWLDRMIEMATRLGIRERSFVSNAIPMHQAGRWASVIAAGATRIVVSAGDFDREVYALMMGVDSFLVFCQSLERLLRANADAGHPAKVQLCIRNALAPSATLTSPAFRAIVRPHLSAVDVRFTVAFDSWSGTLSGREFIGQMRLRPALPATRIPCTGLFQPVVLPDGSVRLCPCRARGSEYDDLVVGRHDGPFHSAALAIARRFYAGIRPAACQGCGMYQPITRAWLRARLSGGPSA